MRAEGKKRFPKKRVKKKAFELADPE